MGSLILTNKLAHLKVAKNINTAMFLKYIQNVKYSQEI